MSEPTRLNRICVEISAHGQICPRSLPDHKSFVKTCYPIMQLSIDGGTKITISQSSSASKTSFSIVSGVWCQSVPFLESLSFGVFCNYTSCSKLIHYNILYHSDFRTWILWITYLYIYHGFQWSLGDTIFESLTHWQHRPPAWQEDPNKVQLGRV